MRLAASLIALLITLPLIAEAQTPSKPSTTAGAKGKAAKPAKPLRKRAPVPTPLPPEPEEIEPERLAVVPMVLRGESSCEFGSKVQVVEHPTLAGRFLLEYRGIKHVLTPQPTSTGVVRLEDKRTGMIWLQVPVKSMLMDSKRGQRLADNCMHASQTAEALVTPVEPSALQ